MRLVLSAELNAERVFFGLAILAMIVNALLDIAMTLPPNLLYYSSIFALIELDARKTITDKRAACADTGKTSEADEVGAVQPAAEKSDAAIADEDNI